MFASDGLAADGESPGEDRQRPSPPLVTENLYGVKAGALYAYSGQFELDPMIALGFNALLEQRWVFFELGLGAMVPLMSDQDTRRGYGGAYADVGANLYLTQTTTSPYLGAGVSPRVLSSQYGHLAAYLQAGVMFQRTRPRRPYVELRINQSINEMHVTDYDLDYEAETETNVRPLEVGLNVGYGW